MIQLLAQLIIKQPQVQFEGKVPYSVHAQLEPIVETFKPIELLEAAFITHPVTDSTNTYPYLQCTWYLKEKRPDLPNLLGDAMFWADRLSALGYEVGDTPQPGAIAQYRYGNHVAYTERIDGDSIYISEGNYNYTGAYNERWVPALEYKYIY